MVYYTYIISDRVYTVLCAAISRNTFAITRGGELIAIFRPKKI